MIGDLSDKVPVTPTPIVNSRVSPLKTILALGPSIMLAVKRACGNFPTWSTKILLVVVVALSGAATIPKASFSASFREQIEAPRVWVDAVRGEMQGAETIFQAFLNKHFVEDIQQGNTDSKWSFDASDQFYAWHDLNSDGYEDVVLIFQHIGHCGTIGCLAFLFLTNSATDFAFEMEMTVPGLGIEVTEIKGLAVKPIFTEFECHLVESGEYVFVSADTQRHDGQEDWNPHACGGHYNQYRLGHDADCQSCHHRRD